MKKRISTLVALSPMIFCGALMAQNVAPADGTNVPGQRQEGQRQEGQRGQRQEGAQRQEGQRQQEGQPAEAAQKRDQPPYEVKADGTVTFQFKAPQANHVELRGDWPGGIEKNVPVAMVKDEQGVWRASVGPLKSDLWSYSFMVDGVEATPSFGRRASPPAGLSANSIVVPGGNGEDFAAHGAPRGSVTYTSAPFMGSQKRFSVYTPPGYYEDTKKRYPVFYLTLGGAHDGSRGAEDSFVFNLLDNMIASGRAQPMIVVILDPDAPDGGSSVGWTQFQGGGNQTSTKYVDAAQAIADQIVPWVDRSFRTVADRNHRAIGGFSSPGAQGFMAGARNPDKFANIGTFSGGFPTWPGVGVQIQTQLDPKQYNGPDLNRVPDMAKLGAFVPKLNASANMKLVFLSVGTSEPLVQTHALMKDFLSQRGVKYHAVEQVGQIHDGRNIRVSLRDFLSLVFK